jgi:hypothetical protein
MPQLPAAASAGIWPAHDHVWRLIHVDFECGGVREYVCDSCSASWFA